jgi:malonyl-CoA O-methyltransferase
MPEYLFSYGTLRQEDVQLSIFGHRLEGEFDVLPGYELVNVTIEDQAFVARSGTALHRNLRFTGAKTDCVEGMLLTLESHELELGDKYEPEPYRRVRVELASGKQAWVYLIAGDPAGDTSIKTAYADWSGSYDTDRNLTRDLDQQVTRDLLAGLSPRLILELGCGTGKNTAFLSTIAERVHALDFSEQMLARAREKISTANTTFEVADISHPWPSADGTIDLVTCNLVLEHIANIEFIFAEAARVLIAGGRLFVSELHPFRQYLGVKAHFNRGEQRREIPAFVHHLSDFLGPAAAHNFSLVEFRESWHAEDQNKPPRLISFLFAKQSK